MRRRLAAAIFFMSVTTACAARAYVLPGGTPVDASAQFQISNLRYPAGWLKTAPDADITAAGITWTTVADPVTPAVPTGILMLGDSITAYGDRAPNVWTATLSYASVVNGGIGGDTTTGMLSRLPALLTNYKPRAIFLEGGVNDLSTGVPQSDTVSNVLQIIKLAAAAGATVYVQAILPVASCYVASPNVTNSAIAARNAAVHAAIVQTAGGQWIDWGAALVNADYLDCIHPLPSGYAKWATAIAPYVNLYR